MLLCLKLCAGLLRALGSGVFGDSGLRLYGSGVQEALGLQAEDLGLKAQEALRRGSSLKRVGSYFMLILLVKQPFLVVISQAHDPS